MEWWIVAAFCAFFVKGLCGFANTLVFTSILSFGKDNINISPVDLLIGFPPNVIMAWKERKHIRLSICLPMAILLVIGSIPGLFFLQNVNSAALKSFFGVVTILLGIEMLIREIRNQKIKENKPLLVIIGISAGILCGLYGVAALMSAYVSRVAKDSHEFKANMCGILIIENSFRIILYSIRGVITVESVKIVGILIPVMLGALALGMISSRLLNEKSAKKVIIVMLIISGAGLIINNIL